MVLRSALLSKDGFSHGFSLRTGGVSSGPFESLNLGRALGDDPASVDENHRRFAHVVGYERVFELSQVHGSRIRYVSPTEDPSVVRQEEGDALVADAPTTAIGIRVADCVPVLIGDVRSGRVGAAHAGWRGVTGHIVPRTVDALIAAGSDVRDLRVALGPHIRVGAFEVGDEVAAALVAATPGGQDDVVVRRDGERPHVDLAVVLMAQLRARGLAEGQLDDVGGCTFSEPDRFFSFRRDGQRSGRHLAVIVARGA